MHENTHLMLGGNPFLELFTFTFGGIFQLLYALFNLVFTANIFIFLAILFFSFVVAWFIDYIIFEITKDETEQVFVPTGRTLLFAIIIFIPSYYYVFKWIWGDNSATTATVSK